MSAVGTDAAFMLEKALEEMDDIFKDAERHKFSSSSGSPLSRHSSSPRTTNTFVDQMKMSLRSIEDFMEGNQYRYNSYQVEEAALFSFVRTLPCVQLFCQRLVDVMLDSSPHESNNQLRLLRRERDGYMSQALQLGEQLKAADHNLTNLREVLAEERMNNMHSRWRTDSAPQHNNEVVTRGGDLQKLKQHIEEQHMAAAAANEEDGSTVSLKARLREKASDVNRLKLTIDELRTSHDAKDTAFYQLQEEIRKLKDENYELHRQSKGSSQLSLMGHNGHTNGSATISRTSSSKTVDGGNEEKQFSKRSSFGKGIFKRNKSYSRSTSEPNLVSNDVRTAFVPLPSPIISSSNGHKLSNQNESNHIASNCQFAGWSVERVIDWFDEEGLGIYAAQCAKVITKGEDLLRFTHIEMERLLGMANPIHQKKLILALQSVQTDGPDYMGRLDHNWIMRWLDDLGLPQYKDVFYENRVDGRVLHFLTVDDLFCMKIFNQLHHISLRRAVQFLRHQRFHPQYFRENANMSEERGDHVMLWTNTRIMQWLRYVDLAEYAPNLRGSGVHGALMVLEPRFNAETLANLLSIPNNKTLLRRHLQAQFGMLVSDMALKQKEMMERTPNFLPLNSSDKHKAKRKGISFGSLRRRRSENDTDQYLCPMNSEVSPNLSPPVPLNPDDLFEPSEDSFSPSLSIHGSEFEEGSSVKTLGQFSQELSNLTSMLNNKQ